jgi:uncharacterized protein YqeY
MHYRPKKSLKSKLI